MKTQKEISQRLRKHRENSGLGQKDIRLKIGMSQQQYQRVESGSDLRVSTLLRILEGLDLELEFIPRQRFGSRVSEPEEVTEQDESIWKDFLGDLED